MVNKSVHGNFSLASGCYVNLDLFGAYRKKPKRPVFQSLYFPCPCFISESLNIPASSVLVLVNITKKILRLRLFYQEKSYKKMTKLDISG